jgi:16S rRNA (uracil1498-N3)-methyltransferase
MADGRGKIRLFVQERLSEGAAVAAAPGQAHYLMDVMRLATGAPVLLFNGRDGEWLAELAPDGRRGCRLICRARVRAQTAPPDLWLLFAPVKKARTDFIVEKATELGAARLLPVLTRRTAAERVREDRLRATATEAAEQCGRLDVPEIDTARPLSGVLAGWPSGRALVFCDEAGDAGGAGGAPPFLAVAPAAPAAILVGPEGGFDPEEAATLRAHPAVVAASLGPRILRAETAVAAALALWQAVRGDAA